MLRINYIGSHTTIPGWPEANTIAGLLDALGRWQLDRRLLMPEGLEAHPDRKPYRGPALKCAGRQYDAERGRTIYLDGESIFPEAPTAVSYLGGFARYSFCFNLDTDDRELIAQLDAAIAANMARDWSAAA